MDVDDSSSSNEGSINDHCTETRGSDCESDVEMDSDSITQLASENGWSVLVSFKMFYRKVFHNIDIFYSTSGSEDCSPEHSEFHY